MMKMPGGNYLSHSFNLIKKISNNPHIDNSMLKVSKDPKTAVADRHKITPEVTTLWCDTNTFIIIIIILTIGSR